MSSLKNNVNFTHSTPTNDIRDALHVNGYHYYPSRSRTPNGFSTPANPAYLGTTVESDLGPDEDPKSSIFKELYVRSEARFGALFGEDGSINQRDFTLVNDQLEEHDEGVDEAAKAQVPVATKKTARAIDDDYDDSDGDDEDDSGIVSPLKIKSSMNSILPTLSSSIVLRGTPSSSAPASVKGSSSSGPIKTTEDVRKRLEEDKKATEEAAKRSFHTFFYTIENDRDAMLDQKKLEESDRQVDVEMNGHGVTNNQPNSSSGNTQGTLSQTNLGASSLTLKHLIARIDAKRDQVRASDSELRTLMSEVRKNRSKWASAEKIGQEELYEAAEKVLSELKAMTEHSTAFLTRVNKREAPDYYNVIKHPMDLGTMTKKLKAVQYKSKQEFVDDINLIWANCLKYNANPEHFLRRHALFMRKETEKLVPLIPPIVIRDRAVVEAEERRLHNGDVEADGLDESDDEPIISSRGRKAPGKTSKKSSNARKAPAGIIEGSPVAENKPSAQIIVNGLGSNLKHESLRADSESVLDRSSTPPPGAITPAGVNGIISHGTFNAHDSIDIDGLDSSLNGIGPSNGGAGEEVEHDDIEYKTWKQVTKRDRALVTAERHRLFKGDRINPEEPALLRTRLGMRRWLRKQKGASSEAAFGKHENESEAVENGSEPSGETLAEGMEGGEERVLPDHYDSLSGVPDLPPRLRWIEDSEGRLQDPSEEFLRVLPPGLFVSPESSLTKRIEDNMRQMQETRKITSKIGIVKQMQLQSQMYHGQFQKHEPAPFIEQAIESHVVSGEGPVVSPLVCRAALQRSVGKLFFHAGFDEFQPSALEAVTDLAADFFTKLAHTLVEYQQAPMVPISTPGFGTSEEAEVTWKPRFTNEEIILHTLHENGSDVDALETYVKDDMERISSKLAIMHERMKAHLADLLRPALNDAGPDGSNAFNDGSEQFVGGDFAEDLDEDFFGFKELGLDKEFGLATLSVPLHLLQNRMHNANQAQNPSALSSILPSALPPPASLTSISTETLSSQIRLVHNFFLAKLHASTPNTPLVEDDDLPQKQRFPKPRLPPTGKISSPRKRPVREQGPGKGHPRKKIKLMEEAKEREKKEMLKNDGGGIKEGEVGGMMSPESIEAQ